MVALKSASTTNVHIGTGPELNFLADLIAWFVFNANLSVKGLSLFDANLSLFRFADADELVCNHKDRPEFRTYLVPVKNRHQLFENFEKPLTSRIKFFRLIGVMPT